MRAASHGTPFSRSAPIPIAERLTDSLGLVILGSAGLLVFGDAWPAFFVVVAGSALLVFIIRNRPLALWILNRLERLPLVARFAQQAEEFYTSSYVLLSPWALGSMTLLSVVSSRPSSAHSTSSGCSAGQASASAKRRWRSTRRESPRRASLRRAAPWRARSG